MVEPAAGPLDARPVDEVALKRAPLVNVVAQVRYPKAPVLATEPGAQAILGRLREHYPVLRETQAVGIVLGPSGAVTQHSGGVVWNFTSRDGTWTISVSDGSASLQTAGYTSREDFCTRLENMMVAVGEVGEMPIADRIGVRYTNQLTGDALSKVPSLIRAELQAGLTIPTGANGDLTLTLVDALFALSGPQSLRVRVRSGLIPSGAMVDPGIPTVAETSWLLDFDSFVESVGDFDTALLGSLSRELAERVYRFFRWAVTEEFLRFFGGYE